MGNRIDMSDGFISSIIKLAEGNPGATTVLSRLVSETPKIDPDSASGGFGPILSLDTHGIYGPRIWMFYKDVCNNSVLYMNAIMRAVQLGLMNESVMQMAIDNYGDGIDLEETLNLVKLELPNFANDYQE